MTKKHGTERHGTKRTLLASIISLILCITMFLGSTLAWFTHTVTNENNRIQMGKLKVDLLMYKEIEEGVYAYDSIADGSGDIFSEATGNGVCWEPGKTEIVFLQVANVEELALNYNIILDVTDLDTTDNVKPQEALEYAILDGWKAENYYEGLFSDWEDLIQNSSVKPQTGAMPSGKVLAAEKGALEAGESDYFALAVHMDEEAGNEYQGKEINIDVQIAAKQMASEYDSFGNQYDADAVYGEETWEPDVPVSYINVLPQGDFEEDSRSWWSLRPKTTKDDAGNVIYTGTSEIIAGDDAPSGSNYLHVSGKLDSDASKRFISLEAGEHIVEAMVKKSGEAIPYFQLRFYDSAEKEISRVTKEIKDIENNQWQEISFTFTAPAGCVKAWLMIGKTYDKEGDVYWDNVQFLVKNEEIDESLYVDTLYNGDFEIPGTFYSSTSNLNHATPDKWVWSNVYSSSGLVTGDGEAYSGDAYVHLKADYSTNMAQIYNDKTRFLEDGKEYILKAWVKKIEKNPILWVIGYKNGVDGNTFSSPQIELTDLVVGEWQEVSYKFTYDADWGNMRFFFRVPNGGEACVDNVRLLTLREEGKSYVVEEHMEFRTMLAEEAEVSQLVEMSDGDPYEERIPLGDNIISDSTFLNSTLDTDGVSDWFATDVNASYGQWVEESHTVDGSGALMLTKSTATNPWYYQGVEEPIIGGAEYQVSYWYKVLDGAEETIRPYIKLETYLDPGVPGVGPAAVDNIHCYAEDYEYECDGEWHRVVMRARVSDNVTYLRVLPFVKNGEGSALIDDIEIHLTQVPKLLTLDTGFKFFYDDDLGNVNFDVKVDTSYYPELADARVDFQVYDGDTLIWEKKEARLSSGMATVEFDLTKLLKKEIPYCVKATLYDQNGEELCAETDNIFVYSRPEYLNADGVFQVEGEEPFVPVLGYTVKEELYDQLHNESGVNLIMIQLSSNTDDILRRLDKLQEKGMKGNLGLYYDMVPAASEESLHIQSVINILTNEEITNHPALYGYVLMDEPFLWDPEPEMDLETSYRLVRKYDTKHPITLVECFPKFFDISAKYTDFLIVDPYFPAVTQEVYEWTSLALDAVEGQRPIFSLTEAYRTATNRYLTGQDARNNSYQALLAGASCVGYYSIGASEKDENGERVLPIWEGKDGGDLWNGVKDFSNKEKELAYDHFVFENSPVFNECLSGDYWYHSWVVDGSVYMVVLGMKDYGVTVDVSIPLVSTNGEVDISDGAVEIIAGTNTAAIQDGNLKLSLSGVDTVLYKITPDDTVDFSSLK